MLNTGFQQRLTWNLSLASPQKKNPQNKTRKNGDGPQICLKHFRIFLQASAAGKNAAHNLLGISWHNWWLPGALEHPLISSGFCHREISGSSQALLGNYSFATFAVTWENLPSQYYSSSSSSLLSLTLMWLLVPTQAASLAMFVFWWGKQGSTWGRGNVPKWEWVPNVEEQPGCDVNSKLVSCP